MQSALLTKPSALPSVGDELDPVLLHSPQNWLIPTAVVISVLIVALLIFLAACYVKAKKERVQLLEYVQIKMNKSK